MGEPHANGETMTIPEPRLIPHVVSEHAKTRPNKVWGSLPKHPTDASQGYEDITFARLNYGIGRAATWMQRSIASQRSRPHETLAYLGPPDSRYIVFAIAAIKTGFQLLFLSPRNSDIAQSSVIEQANCQKFLSSSSMETRIRKLLEDRSELSHMTHYVVPEQDDLLRDEYVPDIPYYRTVAQARYEPLVTLHTSSTTGIPKTIRLTQGYGLHEDVVQHVPKTSSGLDIITRKPFYGDCRMFVAMPLFHAGGVLLTLLKSIYHDIVSVFQPPLAALNAEVFDAILRYGSCNGCVIPPFLLEDMMADYFDTLASLKFVQFGSGPLSQATGNLLLTRQQNCPHFIGSSECGLYLLLELDDPVQDWQYFRFHPWSGIDMRPIGNDADTCEMFVVRSDAPKIPGMQPVFELFPDLDEWPTKDMYVRHPTKPDHWRCIGRNDDVLVLSNGEKINPVDTESRIANAHSSITGALVIGQGQFAPGLLLETRDVDTNDPWKCTALIDEIWPLIQAANKDAPGHGKLHKSLILFTSADKPFLRTPKLSIRRKPTIDLYAGEIDEMYTRYMNEVDEVAEPTQAAAELKSLAEVQDFTLETIRSVTEWDVAPTLEDDLFMHGMDSLQVARVTRAIKRALAGVPRQGEVTTRMIYSHPTAGALSEAIHKLVTVTHPDAGGSAGDVQTSQEEAMDKLIKDYSQFDLLSRLPNGSHSSGKADKQNRLNVLLTGSTGSLGSYILVALLSNPRVKVVYCLNRSKEARDRQLDTLKAQGVDMSRWPDFDSRVRFLHTNSLSEPQLGLSNSDDYHALLNADITHIIHNAWPVNFNLSLASFQTHIAGVRALIDFSISISGMPEIIFISSLSSVTALSARIVVPEAISTMSGQPARMGYGESKSVAERILDNVSKASAGTIRTYILRVGQIAGPVKSSTGTWPTREWLPSLVISSKTIGTLPNSLGRMSKIDWIPVDLLADSIVELLSVDVASNPHVDISGGSQVYHVVNPNATSWSDILPAVMEQTGIKKTLPLHEWIELVRQGPDESSTADPNPAKKILRFYGTLEDEKDQDRGEGNQETSSSGRRFEVGKMAQRSKTFKDMGPVTKDWMSKWTAKWF